MREFRYEMLICVINHLRLQTMFHSILTKTTLEETANHFSFQLSVSMHSYVTDVCQLTQANIDLKNVGHRVSGKNINVSTMV